MFSDLKEKLFCSAEGLKDKCMHMQDEEDPALIQEFLKQTKKKKLTVREHDVSHQVICVNGINWVPCEATRPAAQLWFQWVNICLH